MSLGYGCFVAHLDHTLAFPGRFFRLMNNPGYVVADNYCIHKAKAVAQWLAHHPRFEVLWLPPYCPRAKPMERVFGDVHDKCTRNHQRKRLRDLVQDVEWHVQDNGPWPYKRVRSRSIAIRIRRSRSARLRRAWPRRCPLARSASYTLAQ